MRAGLLLVAALCLAGCDSVTGGGLDFELDAELDQYVELTAGQDSGSWVCRPRLTVTVVGGDAGQVLELVELTAPDGVYDAVSLFGESSLETGRSASTRRYQALSDGTPYTLSVSLTMREPDGTRLDRRSASVACG